MKQTLPEQLRLAAEILDNKREFHCLNEKGETLVRMHRDDEQELIACLKLGHQFEIKPLTFPDPPEGRSWRNPANLTPEQVGVPEWRLLLKGEDRPTDSRVYYASTGRWEPSNLKFLSSHHLSYRTRAPLPAQTPARVPLTAADVPVGSVLKYKIGDYRAEHMVIAKNDECILIGNPSKTFSEVKYEVLFRDWLRMENGTWQPCSKPAE